MVRTLKIFFSRYQESFEAESWYIALETEVYQVCSNEDPRMTFDLFMARSNCVSVYLYRETVENSFSQNLLKTKG